MEFKAKEIADILGGVVEGNPEVTVTGFARIENGKPGTICFSQILNTNSTFTSVRRISS